jgi:RNA polymerase sigma factor (sigma-70 family)
MIRRSDWFASPGFSILLFRGKINIVFFLTRSIFIALYRQKLLKNKTGGEILKQEELDEKITAASKSILSYCVSRTSNGQDAEDLAQDILYEIIKSTANLRDDRAFYGFMWKVAGNVYKQWCRKKLTVNVCELTDDVHEDSDEFTAVLEDNSDIYLLRRELMLLSEKYRRATILYYLENKSCVEISQILSISESMVKYLLFKSRKILKEGMIMERNFGEQSYNPKNLNMMYMGEGPNKYWDLINNNKIRQNILWACYNDSLNEDEIALQIGVSLPYIENDIKTLTDAWLLKKDGNYYRTNIIILTEDFEQEKASKLLPIQKEIAKKLKEFIDANEAEIRNVGFHKNDMSLASLKWHMVTMMLFYAYSAVGDQFFCNETRPVTAFGEHAYLWGVENVKGGFNCCTIRAEEWKTTISMFFMDWSSRPNLHHSDFYANRKWVKMYDKIALGDTDNLNEFEQEIVAEMIHKGYVINENGRVSPAMPVYTNEHLTKMVELQKPVVDEIGILFEKLHKEIVAVLKNHVPTHLKSQVNDIAAMGLFNDGTFVPASLLNQSGYLSTEWVPGEIATSYTVLAD